MRRPSAKWLLLLPVVLFSLAYIERLESGPGSDWRTASRASAGLAPDPADTPEAVVQVYAARAVRWRGYFGVHTWISVKPAGADAFTVYEVIGWRLRRSHTSVVVSDRPADGRWFGAEPTLLADLRGAGVDGVIERIEAAVREYPHAGSYRVWPGPNSNTFTAYVLRHVPEVRASLPATAIGKDYLGPRMLARAPSGTGWQFSVLGIFGVLIAVEEGLEINLLGATLGVSPVTLSLQMPIAGRLGPPRKPPRRAMEPPCGLTAPCPQ